MSLFGTSADHTRYELVPSAPLDVYLRSDDPDIQARVDVLLNAVLETPALANALANYAGEKTKGTFIERIRCQVEIIALNIVEKRALGLAIGMPRGKSTYVAGNLFGASNVTREIIDVADALVEANFLIINTDPSQEFVSRVIPTEELINLLFAPIDNLVTDNIERKLGSSLRTTECGIVLKVSKRVRYSDKAGNKRTKWTDARVPYKTLVTMDYFAERDAEIRRWQDFLWSFQITYVGPRYERVGLVLREGTQISGKLQRHFKNSLETPLRFYGAWQQLPSDLRRYIQINDQRTAELDFRCFFPVLLLTQAGIDWTDRFPLRDAYTLTRLHLGADNPQEFKALRNFLKAVFVTYCFDSVHTPENVIRRFELEIRDYEESESYGVPEKANLPVLGSIARIKQMPAREALGSVVEEYCSLFAGVGKAAMDWVQLQQQESTITESVLNACAQHGIPCLPIHDGYQVQSGIHSSKVEDFMRTAFKEVTGSSNILIKNEDKEESELNT